MKIELLVILNRALTRSSTRRVARLPGLGSPTATNALSQAAFTLSSRDLRWALL